uniref:Glycosyl hydrolase family 32 N-terminal domain-containing protein n=1 Tax=Marinomonas sp. (strain MWYL1) TaxID=400668 RepID=A6VTI2_MARMS
MKNWSKQGLIYAPLKIDEMLSTHASNALPIFISDDVYRVFFSGRNSENKSSVGWFDFDIVKQEILYICDETFLSCSEKSRKYYSHGISLGCYLHDGVDIYVYFMAWQIEGNNHWRGDVGRFCLDQSKKLKYVDDTPYMISDEEDPVSLSYPFILKDDGLFRMWYGSTISWDSPNGEMVHVIKYATSKDGVNWDKHGIAIPFELGVAQAFSRPCVIKRAGIYHMWFSYRSGDGSTYRIGYAKSIDAINWDVDFDSGVAPSKDGWDSEMVCYPYIFSHKEKVYMLYNGNAHGKTGIGLAVYSEVEI